MRNSELELIRTLPLFREVSAAHFAGLVEAAFLQRFPAQVLLIEEGQPPDFLHIMVEGTVELFATHAERETTIDIIQPVTTFILAAVIRDKVYLKSARSLTPARILMIPAANVRKVISRDAAFARAVVDELAERYRSVVRALKNEKLRTSAERVANWILQAEKQQGGRGRIELKYDKRTLASHLGMTPENLSRNLAFLGSYGVTTHGREIFIEERDALELFAKPSPLIDGLTERLE